MSKVNKPKPIRRQGPNGPQEINPLSSGFIPTEAEILAASIRLGQTEVQAQNTLRDYLEEMIDESDAKLLHEEIKAMRKENVQIGITTAKAKISGIEAAHIDPRNPRGGIHSQKVMRRDSFGRIVGVEAL